MKSTTNKNSHRKKRTNGVRSSAVEKANGKSASEGSKNSVEAQPPNFVAIIVMALIVLVLAWSYGPSIKHLVRRWWNEPDYLYGFLVPVFSGVLLWYRRDMLKTVTFRGTWWGLVLIGFAAAMRWASAYYFFALLEPMSLVPCLAGIVLIVVGWPGLRWSWPAIIFLGFMVPLPGFIAGMLSHPMQRVGTIASTFVVQTLGIPSLARGNVIVLPESELGVAEACNGLPMMMLFFAVCVGAVFLSQRSWLERLIILASAPFIAILANVIRISLTAVCYQLGGEALGNAIFHDLAGWFMMPLAVLLLWLELWILDHVLVDKETQKPVFVNT